MRAFQVVTSVRLSTHLHAWAREHAVPVAEHSAHTVAAWPGPPVEDVVFPSETIRDGCVYSRATYTGAVRVKGWPRKGAADPNP